MLTRLARFRELSGATRALLLRAWWWLLVFWLLVRTVSFTRVRRLAEIPLSSPADGGVPTPVPVSSLTWCVDAARRSHPLPMRCLERSLTLQRLLRQQGLPATLEIGIERAEASLVAHAWVEIEGEAIAEFETVGERYARFVSAG